MTFNCSNDTEFFTNKWKQKFGKNCNFFSPAIFNPKENNFIKSSHENAEFNHR